MKLLLVILSLVVAPFAAADSDSTTKPKQASPVRFKVANDVELPAQLRAARDIRWYGDSSVVLAAGRPGLFEFFPATGKSNVLVPGTGPGSFFFAARVASSDGRLLVASVFRSLAVKTSQGVTRPFPFELIVDADISGDRIAILGATRARTGEWNPEGGVVWLGKLEADGTVTDLRPLIVSEERGDRDPVNRCHYLELGALRFLSDGSLLVAPGLVPGVFLYGSNGRLIKTWETEGRGFEDRCRLSDAEHLTFVKEPLPRFEWINEHTVVDDVLILPSGPALVLRAIDGQQTKWSLLHLLPDGNVRAEPLPLSSRSTFAHVRGDVRGKTIAFVVLEYGLSPDAPPPAPPRVVLVEVAK
ncbi:MAG: hypothetical protein WC538_17750 [Thermoanaerobaculia bacterium]|jgi:hypothetical protein